MDIQLLHQPDSAIAHITLTSAETLYAQAGCMIAMSANIEADTTLRQGKGGGFFSGESLFLIRAVGEGDFWFSSYGAIIEVPVTEEYIVDTGYIVAFEDSLDYSYQLSVTSYQKQTTNNKQQITSNNRLFH